MSDKCDFDVYTNGTTVFLTHTIRAKEIEIWVQKIALDSGQKVDWHYVGGRAFVLSLGNLNKVKATILANRKMHDDFYKKAVSKLRIFNEQEISRTIDGIWRYNGFE